MTAIYLLALSPIFIATVGFFLPRAVYKHALIAYQIVQVAFAFHVFRVVRTGVAIVERVGLWPRAVGVTLLADYISAPLVLLTTVLFLLFFLFNYRKRYMDNLFQFLYITAQGVIISMFLSNDIFNVYVLSELSSIIVAVLIMYKRDKQTLYDGLFYFLMNLFVMAFFLLGLGFTYKILGVLDFHAMHDQIGRLASTKAVILPYALLMTAVGMKSAIFPLFSWLPRAHGAPSAPSAVSAMLSGIQVKVGVYLYLRLQAAYQPYIDTTTLFLLIGFVTAVTGFLLAICQKDIKLILAYHTVSQVGLIMMGLNAGSRLAWYGGVYHIMSHALFKALLFLTAGLIIKEYGSRNVTQIRGALRRMPLVSVAALMAVLGITGAPFFNGSISKYMIERGGTMALWPIAMYVVNLGTIVSFVKYSTMFFGRADGERRQRDPFSATVSLLFGLACLAGGIGAAPAIRFLYGYDVAVSGALGPAKFATFAATVVIGVLIYRLVVLRSQLPEKVRDFHFSYNGVTTAVTGFFALLLGYLYVVT